MLQPIRLDLQVRRYNAFLIVIPLSDEGGHVNGWGWGARLQVRTSPGAPGDPLLDLTQEAEEGDSRVYFNTDGNLVIDLAEPDVTALPANAEEPDEVNALSWDVIVMGPDLRPLTVRYGLFNVVPTVTRAPPPPVSEDIGGGFNFSTPSNSGFGLYIGAY